MSDWAAYVGEERGQVLTLRRCRPWSASMILYIPVRKVGINEGSMIGRRK